MTEENNIWQYLRTLTEAEVDKLKSIDPYAPLPNGIVTDGEGNFYEIPKKGHTPLVPIEGEDDSVMFSYDWEKRELKIYLLEIDNNSYYLLDAYPLSPENFLDNPEYWYKVVAVEHEADVETLKEEIQDLEVSESVNNAKDYAFKYNVLAYVKFHIVNGDYENFNSYVEDYNQKLVNIANDATKIELFGHKFTFDAVYHNNMGQIVTTINSDVALDLSDIIELYEDEIKPRFSVITPKYTVKVTDIESIKEI